MRVRYSSNVVGTNSKGKLITSGLPVNPPAILGKRESILVPSNTLEAIHNVNFFYKRAYSDGHIGTIAAQERAGRHQMKRHFLERFFPSSVLAWERYALQKMCLRASSHWATRLGGTFGSPG
jgi:hypothetical protein